MCFRRGLPILCSFATLLPSDGVSLHSASAPVLGAGNTSLAEIDPNTNARTDASRTDQIYSHKPEPRVPIINFRMDTLPHFEVLCSLIHWFKGGDLPYRRGIPFNVQRMVRDARIHGSEVYVNSDFVKTADREEILFQHMKDYNIKYGMHLKPDLTVIITVYSDLSYFERGAANHWKNRDNVLLIVHDYETSFTEKDVENFTAAFRNTSDLDGVQPAEFLDFRNWNNAIGLAPTLPRYVLPSYFPYRGTPKKRDENWYATFCEQGNFKRRDFDSLKRALDLVNPKCKFDLKLAGVGQLPQQLRRHKDRIALLHLKDVAFNDFFQYQCDFLLPLVDDTTDPNYLHSKLVSTMARAIGYRLPVIAFHTLQKMYPMVDGTFYKDDASFRDRIEEAAQCK